jgi:hypothetical protein
VQVRDLAGAMDLELAEDELALLSAASGRS